MWRRLFCPAMYITAPPSSRSRVYPGGGRKTGRQGSPDVIGELHLVPTRDPAPYDPLALDLRNPLLDHEPNDGADSFTATDHIS